MTKHIHVLNRIQAKLKSDPNVIALLLFGSVASGTFTQDSDIDTIVVYKDLSLGHKLSSEIVDGIEVSYSQWAESELVENVKQVPYILFVFYSAKILFDRGSVTELQNKLVNYFSTHTDILREWQHYCIEYKKQKEASPEQKTHIVDIFNELESKYSGGEIKRTFARNK
jgi:predicted nucleotidyltransferase